MEDKKIYPIIEETVFMDKFIGMDQYFPCDEENRVLHRATIVDAFHFEYNNEKFDIRTIAEADIFTLPSEKILSALHKFTEVKTLFNEEYYVVGENYCQIDSTFSPVGQLIEFTPTQLTFKPLNDDDVAAIKGDNYVITNREDVYKIWLRLGVNRKGDVITKSKMFDTSFIKKNCRDYILYDAVGDYVIYLDYNRPMCGTWISTSKGNITLEAYEKHLSLYKIQSGYADHEPKLIKCDNSDLIYEGLTFNLDVEPGKYVYIKREIANNKYHFDKTWTSSGYYVEIPSSGYDHFNTPAIGVKVDKIEGVYIVDDSCLKDEDFVLNK